MSTSRVSRRLLLGSALALSLANLARAGDLTGPLTQQQRQRLVFERRRDAAQAQLDSALPPHATNGDEDRYPDRRASFSKTMPHNDLGEVDPEAYHRWLAILASGDPAQFDRVPRDPRAVERLNDPQATYATDLVGLDATALPFPPPPAFASQANAAEMAELYWLALMRDVSFREYAADPLGAAAVADLNAVGFAGVDTATLFRGEANGDRRGPFVSQFLWHDIPYGLKTVDQRFRVPSRDQRFLTSFEAWLACQRGVRPAADLRFEADPRYIANYRALSEYVHRDFSFQPFMDAALIILRMGGERGDDVLSPSNPYRGSRTQFGDITLGNKNLLTLLAQASLLARKTSYYQKWQVHRRARPESFGGRIEVHLSGRKSYDIHPAILHSEGLARVKAATGSWLLPMAYAEGCPTHPSYPAAHAVNAGACATVLKAFVNESFEIPLPVEASADGAELEPWRGAALTLGGEIDKLASNIALARDAAGVHFRSDSIAGLKLGEAVALGLLADYSRTYNEQFDGFVVTRFDGETVQIANGSLRNG
jgi:membrane-associated phospholipid phosphatase